jgi:hypothetical protein
VGIAVDECNSCSECGAPEYITSEHLWLNSGVIVQNRDRKHRLVFIECENLDPLFREIGRIIGTTIEPVVVDSRRRGARDYAVQFVTDEVKEQIRRGDFELEPIIQAQLHDCRMMGFGRAEISDFRFERDENDFIIIRVEDPFSMPLWCGSLAGGCEAIVGGEWGVSHRELSPGLCEITATIAKPRPYADGKAGRCEYVFKEGDLELERCSTCGGPAVLSQFRWDLEKGIVGSAYTDRRMSINGETGLQEVFRELEEEMGDVIPCAVIEAQRSFVKSGFYSIEGLLSEGDFRTQFAYRGFGNLRDFLMGSTGLHLRLENATFHLIVVGLAQALFELAFGRDSLVDWELSEEGDLEIEVIPVPSAERS